MSVICLHSFPIGIFPKLTKDITPLHTTDRQTGWETEDSNIQSYEVRPSKSIGNLNIVLF
jgi:hypothetical protein